MKRIWGYAAVAPLLCLGLFAAASAVEAQSSHRPPRPIHHEGKRLCTVMDGNPYSVVIERGTCGLGESEVTGGGDGGAGAGGSTGAALAAHCQTQYAARLAICNAMKNGGLKQNCVSSAALGLQMCMQSMVQSPFPY